MRVAADLIGGNKIICPGNLGISDPARERACMCVCLCVSVCVCACVCVCVCVCGGSYIAHKGHS